MSRQPGTPFCRWSRTRMPCRASALIRSELSMPSPAHTMSIWTPHRPASPGPRICRPSERAVPERVPSGGSVMRVARVRGDGGAVRAAKATGRRPDLPVGGREQRSAPRGPPPRLTWVSRPRLAAQRSHREAWLATRCQLNDKWRETLVERWVPGFECRDLAVVKSGAPAVRIPEIDVLAPGVRECQQRGTAKVGGARRRPAGASEGDGGNRRLKLS